MGYYKSNLIINNPHISTPYIKYIILIQKYYNFSILSIMPKVQ